MWLNQGSNGPAVLACRRLFLPAGGCAGLPAAVLACRRLCLPALVPPAHEVVIGLGGQAAGRGFRLQMFQHIRGGNHVAILGVDIQQVGLVGALRAVAHAVAHHHRVIAVLERIDGRGPDAAAGGAAGDNTITVQDSSTSYWTLDAFENGTFNYNGSTVWSCRIESSTATGTGGGNANCSVVTIETTFPISFLTEESTVRFLKSKYMDVTRASGPNPAIHQAAIGVGVCFNFPGREITTSGYYGWIQTWGETCIQIATSHKGGSTGERQLHALGAGGAQLVDSGDKNQIIGHYLQKTQSNMDKPLIYLMIAP